jgi:hypothetical protein
VAKANPVSGPVGFQLPERFDVFDLTALEQLGVRLTDRSLVAWRSFAHLIRRYRSASLDAVATLGSAIA